MCRVIQILFDCKSLKTLSFLYTFVSALHIVLPTKQHSRFSYWIAKACGKGFVDLAGSRSIFLLNLTIYCRFKKLSQVSLRDRYSFWLQNIIQTILFVSFYIQFEVAERFISFHQLHFEHEEEIVYFFLGRDEAKCWYKFGELREEQNMKSWNSLPSQCQIIVLFKAENYWNEQWEGRFRHKEAT